MTTSTTTPKPLWRKLLPPAFWLGVWQLSAYATDLALNGQGNELLLPYPMTVVQTLLSLAGNGDFWLTAFYSLGRVLAGMVYGTAAGLLLAALTCLSALADELLSPAIRVIRATPVASFILLVMLWLWGYRDWVPVVIAALMILPVVWANVSRGIREVDPQLLEMAKAYRFSRSKTIRLIYMPSLRPYVLSAITTAMGLAWKSGVAAEVLCLPGTAIGTQIFYTKYYLEVPQLFAWTVVVVTMSLVMERLLTAALNRGNRRWET